MSHIVNNKTIGVSMHIIQALPALGKSYLGKNNPGEYVDTDFMIGILAGDKSKAGFDWLDKDGNGPAILQKACRLIGGNYGHHTILTNTWMIQHSRNFAHDVFLMEPDDYITHIKKVGRIDLIDIFGEDVLRSWPRSYLIRGAKNLEKFHILKPGEFVTDFRRDSNRG